LDAISGRAGARGFRVASYDMLGKANPISPTVHRTADQVAVLRDLIAALGPRPVFVGGISFGGVIGYATLSSIPTPSPGWCQ